MQPSSKQLKLAKWLLSNPNNPKIVAGGRTASLEPHLLFAVANRAVIVFDLTTKKLVRTIGGGLFRKGELFEPVSLCIGLFGDNKRGDDHLFVSDQGNHQVQVFSLLTGSHIAMIGDGEGSGVSQMNRPSAICIGTNKNLYVADSGNNRIQIFDLAKKGAHVNAIQLKIAEEGGYYYHQRDYDPNTGQRYDIGQICIGPGPGAVKLCLYVPVFATMSIQLFDLATGARLKSISNVTPTGCCIGQRLRPQALVEYATGAGRKKRASRKKKGTDLAEVIETSSTSSTSSSYEPLLFVGSRPDGKIDAYCIDTCAFSHKVASSVHPNFMVTANTTYGGGDGENKQILFVSNDSEGRW